MILAILVLMVIGCFYFFPTILSASMRKKNTPAIGALNLLLGWTFIGWVAALVWTLTKEGSQ